MNRSFRAGFAHAMSAIAISCAGTPDSEMRNPIAVPLRSTVRVALERNEDSTASATVLGINDDLPTYIALPEDVLIQFFPEGGSQSLVISNQTESLLHVDVRYCLDQDRVCERPETLSIGSRGFQGVVLPGDEIDLVYLSNFRLDDAK